MKTPQDLQEWKYHDYLTIREASYLVLGINPNDRMNPRDINYYDSAEIAKLFKASRDEIDKQHSLITNALCNAVDAKGMPSFDTDDFHSEPKIATDDLIPWLEKHNIDAPFFSNENPAQKPIERPEYRTHMITVMYDVIERYYGENYDPTNRESVTTGGAVIEWIRANFNSSDGTGEPLSFTEAKAIDTMTRPDHVRKPQAKKTRLNPSRD